MSRRSRSSDGTAPGLGRISGSTSAETVTTPASASRSAAANSGVGGTSGTIVTRAMRTPQTAATATATPRTASRTGRRRGRRSSHDARTASRPAARLVIANGHSGVPRTRRDSTAPSSGIPSVSGTSTPVTGEGSRAAIA